ncbi:MAG: iron-containing alcohol dehydrogenase [Verrucomicrobiae bacterium]|nr:iron-containing alcohol dehydrogenase [Verrucomicrobiae bacterium]
MNNFIYQNPVKIVFGKGEIARLCELIPAEKKILMTYGGGSIKRNGVYDQVKSALKGRSMLEFGGIEPNPRYETLMKAVDVCRKEKVDFLLSVGGGSVLDGTKFIALAVKYKNGDPWDILAKHATANEALPIGCVLTLPATGSEMNMFSVISRDSTQEKLAFANPLVYPKFSILDPETTFTLDAEQTANGIVDAYAHVMEQYMTYPVYAPLQDRQAEAILLTLIEEGPKVLQKPKDYNARSAIMWCSTQALNGLIACGVPQDWTTHMIGHELTAFYGLAHARTLAIVMPGVLRHQINNKKEKLLQYGQRVWGISPSETNAAEKAIEKTESFFRSLGFKTKLSENGIGKEKFEEIAGRFRIRGIKLGERQNIGPEQVIEILNLCL